MSLREQLEIASQRKPGPKCSVGVTLAAIPATDRPDLEECLAAVKTITNRALQDHFEDTYQVFLSAQQLARHRRGACGCL